MPTIRSSGRVRSSCCSSPNLQAYVVTAERAARRFQALGVDKPWS